MMFRWPFTQKPPFDTSPLQKQSFAAGRLCGNDPETPYGMRCPDGLDPVAFAAGLIEGRTDILSAGHRALKGRSR